MKAINKVIRPTNAVRQLMKAHGAGSGAWNSIDQIQNLIWTNKYEKCRTVKCYVNQIDNLEQFEKDLIELFDTLGYGCPQMYVKSSNNPYRQISSVIVRIPNYLQR